MAIQTVTTENLGEIARAKNASASADGPQGNPIVSTGEERHESAPPEASKPEKDAKPKEPKENPVQSRIDELTRQRKEVEELWQEEYESRLKLEGELNALKAQPPKVDEPKPQELKKPIASEYQDQDKYVEDLSKYIEEMTVRRIAKERAEAQAREDAQRANEELAKRIARAKADIPDFEAVIAAADRKAVDIPPHIKAAIIESEVGPQLAYHLAKNPEDQARIFKLKPAAALLALGKIEDQYTPRAKEKEPEAPTSTPVSTAPEPVARLKDAPAPITSDLSQPMKFADYKQLRRQQLAAKRRH